MRNRGIDAAEGEFVCQLNDDRWRPPNVEKQVRRFEELVEECGVVYTGGIVYRNDEEVGWYRPSKHGYLYPEILTEFGLAPHSSHTV